ncbi:hypothetical protein CKO51_12015 [Rhodopirellula sp. SM50]|nr:HAD-IA family hydrolase [Rhodopirellula sp. SM50]PAY19331.1 hypothetical protein CKO51_12015 [Rhodopirellula sp. SM50]
MKGLIFDNGDILFDASRWRRWLADYLTRHGNPVTYPQLVAIWEKHLVSVYRAKRDYWVAFVDMLSELGIPDDVHSNIIDKAKAKGAELQQQRQPMPMVVETLAALSDQGIRLAVLSDSESGEVGVRKILRQLGVESNFDAVISSADIGLVKPEPAAFQAAADAIDLAIAECGFVGHDVDELQGAREIGLFAIGYNFDPDAPADVYIQHFDELIELVNRQ